MIYQNIKFSHAEPRTEYSIHVQESFVHLQLDKMNCNFLRKKFACGNSNVLQKGGTLLPSIC